MMLLWTALLVTAVATGIATCATVVCLPRRISVYAIASAAAAIGSACGLAGVWRSTGRTDTLVAGAFLGLGAYLGGFALGAALIPSLLRYPPPRVPGPADGAGRAFIVLADGQPERYDPRAVTELFDLLSATDVPVPPDALRAFAYLSERLRYRAAGMSPARPVVAALVARVQRTLQERGVDAPVRVAWTRGTPRLADVVAETLDDGCGSVVVGVLDVAESARYERAKSAVAALAGAATMERLVFAAPLWTDRRLAHLVARRVLDALPRGPRATDGVVLVAEGQPWQWDESWPASCEHVTFFLQRVRAELVDAGATDAHVRLAWLDWQEPGVTEVVRHLAALGCERIVITPGATPADTTETVLDLPAAIEQAALDPGVRVEVLRGWGDDEVVATVLADALLQAAGDPDAGVYQ